jgi:hypothetical protein
MDTKLTLPRETPDISPLVQRLSGVISLPEGYDHKKKYGDFLAAKYSVLTDEPPQAA